MSILTAVAACIVVIFVTAFVNGVRAQFYNPLRRCSWRYWGVRPPRFISGRDYFFDLGPIVFYFKER